MACRLLRAARIGRSSAYSYADTPIRMAHDPVGTPRSAILAGLQPVSASVNQAIEARVHTPPTQRSPRAPALGLASPDGPLSVEMMTSFQ